MAATQTTLFAFVASAPLHSPLLSLRDIAAKNPPDLTGPLEKTGIVAKNTHILLFSAHIAEHAHGYENDLATSLPLTSPGIRFNDHMEEVDGPTVFQQACKLGLEGIVSKRKDFAVSFRPDAELDQEQEHDAPAVKREAEEDWGTMVTRKGETSELVTMGHIQDPGLPGLARRPRVGDVKQYV